MTEDPVGVACRPGQDRFGKFLPKIPEIEVVEYLFKVVNRAFGRRDDLAAMGAFAIVRPLTHVFGGDVIGVDAVRVTRNPFP
jgi:hypothetical protein